MKEVFSTGKDRRRERSNNLRSATTLFFYLTTEYSNCERTHSPPLEMEYCVGCDLTWSCGGCGSERTEQKTLLSVDSIVAAISALHSKTVLLLLLLVMA